MAKMLILTMVEMMMIMIISMMVKMTTTVVIGVLVRLLQKIKFREKTHFCFCGRESRKELK